MLPSASDTAGIFHNSMGVGVLRWQAQQTHFCKRANFVDGVYIIDIYNIYKYLSFVRPECGCIAIQSKGFPQLKGPFMCSGGPSGQVAWVHVFPAFRRAKISPGIASKMVSKGTWTSELPTKSFSRESIGFFNVKLGVVPTQIHPLHSFVVQVGFLVASNPSMHCKSPLA